MEKISVDFRVSRVTLPDQNTRKTVLESKSGLAHHTSGIPLKSNMAQWNSAPYASAPHAQAIANAT
jgi:hypothetical protein